MVCYVVADPEIYGAIIIGPRVIQFCLMVAILFDKYECLGRGSRPLDQPLGCKLLYKVLLKGVVCS